MLHYEALESPLARFYASVDKLVKESTNAPQAGAYEATEGHTKKRKGRENKMEERMQSEGMRQEAEKRGLKIGANVTATYYALDKAGGYIARRKVRGVVLMLYKHFFSVQIGKRVVCYRYNEFLGNENVKVRLKA